MATTATLLTLTDELGTAIFFVDTRDVAGNLLASESFADERSANEHLILIG